MMYVYVLRSEFDGEYYIGQTQNLENRLALHNRGKVKSTRLRRPLKLVGYEVLPTRETARYFEFQLKHHSDKKQAFIRKLVEMQRL
jgi:putative endonuclease